MNLKDRIKSKLQTRVSKLFGAPIMIGWSGDRKANCKFYALRRSYRTEYCQRPEHIKIHAELQGGRGIIHGCEDCVLNGGKGVEFE